MVLPSLRRVATSSSLSTSGTSMITCSSPMIEKPFLRLLSTPAGWLMAKICQFLVFQTNLKNIILLRKMSKSLGKSSQIWSSEWPRRTSTQRVPLTLKRQVLLLEAWWLSHKVVWPAAMIWKFRPRTRKCAEKLPKAYMSGQVVMNRLSWATLRLRPSLARVVSEKSFWFNKRALARFLQWKVSERTLYWSMIRLNLHYSKSRFFRKLITPSSLVWSTYFNPKRDSTLSWSLSAVASFSCTSGKLDNSQNRELNSTVWPWLLPWVIYTPKKLSIVILNPKISWWVRMVMYA